MPESQDPLTQWLVGPNRERGADYAYLLGYALDPEGTTTDLSADPRSHWDSYSVRCVVALELAGPATSVNALRRDLRRGEYLRISERGESRGRSRQVQCHPAPSSYAALLKPLPGGWTHALILHPRATLAGVQMDHPFYLVAPALIGNIPNTDGTEASRLRHFIGALDRAIPQPLLAPWAAWLWTAGQAADLIHPVRACDGLHAFRVLAVATIWGRLIRQGIEEGQLTVEARA